ncbi:uncharacterized protein METZ01_LOCUS364106, partial [marine metagenome]
MGSLATGVTQVLGLVVRPPERAHKAKIE